MKMNILPLRISFLTCLLSVVYSIDVNVTENLPLAPNVTLAPTSNVTEAPADVTHAPEPETTTVMGILDGSHVVITGPQNLDVYYTGDTFIYLVWDAPPVYHTFDFNETKVNATKQRGSYIAEGKVSSLVDDDSKCHPAKFFTNYTIGLRSDPVDKDGLVAIKFHEEENITTEKITLSGNMKIVDFDKGCLLSYQVDWKETGGGYNQGSYDGLKALNASESSLNITELKGDSEFEVSVTAKFLSGDSVKSKPIYITTKAADVAKTCHCDIFGSKKECSPEKDTEFCECQVGYWGPFCRNCKKGYFRHSSQDSCKPCPCNTQSARSIGCHFNEGFLQCDKCETGYRGNGCHTCDVGYYKSSSGHCIPCFCNGHSPLTGDSDTCHTVTGECMNCDHNTTGFFCSRCKPGYTREPIADLSLACHLDPNHVANVGESSYKMSPVFIGALVIAALVLVFLMIGGIWLKRKQSRRENWKFWTVEMKRDQEDDDFATVHNDEVDDLDFYDQKGRVTSSSKYARLNEEL